MVFEIRRAPRVKNKRFGVFGFRGQVKANTRWPVERVRAAVWGPVCLRSRLGPMSLLGYGIGVIFILVPVPVPAPVPVPLPVLVPVRAPVPVPALVPAPVPVPAAVPATIPVTAFARIACTSSCAGASVSGVHTCACAYIRAYIYMYTNINTYIYAYT